jgi:hypothetical protein
MSFKGKSTEKIKPAKGINSPEESIVSNLFYFFPCAFYFAQGAAISKRLILFLDSYKCEYTRMAFLLIKIKRQELSKLIDRHRNILSPQ